MSKRGSAAAKQEPEMCERRLHVMVTESQWTKLQMLAAAQGLTPSAWVRQQIATAETK